MRTRVADMRISLVVPEPGSNRNPRFNYHYNVYAQLNLNPTLNLARCTFVRHCGHDGQLERMVFERLKTVQPLTALRLLKLMPCI